MTSPTQLRARPLRWRVLLVLGLLVGLLGMHALASGGGAHGHEGDTAAHTTVAAAGVDQACHDGCGSGYLHHADATCASGAVSGGPVLPALAPDPSARGACAVDPCARTTEAQDGARTPPSLAELQLLRI